MSSESVKRWISQGELWPYYTLQEDSWFHTSVPNQFTPEFIENYKRVMSEFSSLQDELERLYEE